MAFKDLESIGEMFEGYAQCIAIDDTEVLSVILSNEGHALYMKAYRADGVTRQHEYARQRERNKRPETKECKREWNRKRRADPAYREAERARNRERMRRAREQAIQSIDIPTETIHRRAQG